MYRQEREKRGGERENRRDRKITVTSTLQALRDIQVPQIESNIS